MFYFSSNGSYSLQHVHREALKAWLTCDFDHTYSLFYTDIFMEYGKDTHRYKDCVVKKNGNENINSRMQRCKQDLKAACLNSKVILVKTIRTPMKMVLSLMNEVTDLKVINLVRDPRSTLSSKLMISGCHDGLKPCAHEYCRQVEEDGQAKEQAVTYRDNILTVTYEDIARTPVKVSSVMYQFMNMTFPQSNAEYVFNITVAGDRSNCDVCRQYWQLGNDTESSLNHIDSWKHTMSKNIISVIEDICHRVMKMYHYS